MIHHAERDEDQASRAYGGEANWDHRAQEWVPVRWPGVAGIWLAVVFASIFAPDLVTGTTQDHFPVALVVGVLAGLAATRSVVRAFTQRIGGASRWAGYDLAVGAIWLAVGLTSIFLPVTVSGTDPTRMPVAALVAPIAGAILTGAITELFVAARR